MADEAVEIDQETAPEPTEAEKAQTERRVASATLEEGVDFTVRVDALTWLHRLGLRRRERTVRVYPLKLGTLFRIAQIVDGIPKPNEEDWKDRTVLDVGVELVLRQKDALVAVVALAVVNRPRMLWTRLVAWRLRRFLDANLSAAELLRLVELVCAQMDVSRFLACTGLIGRLKITGAKQKNGSTSGE